MCTKAWMVVTQGLDYHLVSYAMLTRPNKAETAVHASMAANLVAHFFILFLVVKTLCHYHRRFSAHSVASTYHLYHFIIGNFYFGHFFLRFHFVVVLDVILLTQYAVKMGLHIFALKLISFSWSIMTFLLRTFIEPFCSSSWTVSRKYSIVWRNEKMDDFW